jgi:hypothetical protein
LLDGRFLKQAIVFRGLSLPTAEAIFLHPLPLPRPIAGQASVFCGLPLLPSLLHGSFLKQAIVFRGLSLPTAEAIFVHPLPLPPIAGQAIVFCGLP